MTSNWEYLFEADYPSDLISDHLVDEVGEATILPAAYEGERKEIEKGLQEAVAIVVKHLEGFTEREEEHLIDYLMKERTLWKYAVDWYFCRDAVFRISKVIGRFQKLAPNLVGRSPDKEVNAYVRESCRCYLYGFFQGSAALSRAALERGINEKLEERLGHTPRMSLKAKVDQAATWNILPGHVQRMALEVVEIGNRVLHDQPVSENEAFKALTACRGALRELC